MTFAEKIWGDCSNAVAYSLNFVQMCYGNRGSSCYYKSACSYCNDFSILFKDEFEFPKGGFSKKDYYITDLWTYGVSETLMNDMIDLGIDKSNFKPIRYSVDHKTILGYSVLPVNFLPDTYHLNDMRKFVACKKCGRIEYELKDDSNYFNAYGRIGYPDFINEEALSELKLKYIAYTSDKKNILIAKEIYEKLLEKYPRIECRPVFLGNVENDKEFIRLKYQK